MSHLIDAQTRSHEVNDPPKPWLGPLALSASTLPHSLLPVQHGCLHHPSLIPHPHALQIHQSPPLINPPLPTTILCPLPGCHTHGCFTLAIGSYPLPWPILANPHHLVPSAPWPNEHAICLPTLPTSHHCCCHHIEWTLLANGTGKPTGIR